MIYHSHTATEAYPSRTDISYACEPDAHYVLVSTRDAGRDGVPFVPDRRRRGDGGGGPGRRPMRGRAGRPGVIAVQSGRSRPSVPVGPPERPQRPPVERRHDPGAHSMAIEVRIPTILRNYTDGAKAVEGRAPRSTSCSATWRPVTPGCASAWSTTRACAVSSTSTSTTRTCVSWAGWTPRCPTVTRSPCCPPSPAADALTGRAGARPRGAMRFDSLLDSLGGTPAGRAAAAVPRGRRTPVGEAGGPQPDRLGQGPARVLDDRQGGEGRAADAGLHDPGAHLRQHRHLAGHGRPAARLQDDLRDAGEHLGRAPPAAADVGRADHPLARPRAAPTRPYASPRGWPPSTPTG